MFSRGSLACTGSNRLLRLSFLSGAAITSSQTARALGGGFSPMEARGGVSASTSASASSEGGLFLFDFDGVVCDSCDECTVSALRTCQRLGALDEGTGAGDLGEPPRWLSDKMREIRPAIEVGWQIPVLLSTFLNQKAAEDGGDGVAMTVEQIIADYERLVDEWLARYGKTDADMVQVFGDVRDEWIADDQPSWLDINKFYPGVPEAINSCQGQSVLVTPKQQRFAVALCRHAGVTDAALPDGDIYGLGMYKKKADVIVDRMRENSCPPARTHFFEDRWPTLSKCLKDERLGDVKFFLCSWGYCTKQELALAEKEPRVEVIDLEGFGRIVKG